MIDLLTRIQASAASGIPRTVSALHTNSAPCVPNIEFKDGTPIVAGVRATRTLELTPLAAAAGTIYTVTHSSQAASAKSAAPPSASSRATSGNVIEAGDDAGVSRDSLDMSTPCRL